MMSKSRIGLNSVSIVKNNNRKIGDIATSTIVSGNAIIQIPDIKNIAKKSEFLCSSSGCI